MNANFSFPVKLITIYIMGIFLIAGCTGLPGINRNVGGSGYVVKETRPIQNITEVVLSEEGDLFIEIGNQEELVIEAEDNLQEYLVPNVRNHVLELKKLPENVTLNATKPIRYYLTVKELNSLIVKSSGDVEVAEVDTDVFSIQITGSGSVHIRGLNARSAEIELTSSGNLIIEGGKVQEQHVRLSSSGEYDGKNVVCQSADVKLTSSGDAMLNVLDTLTADLSSSGNVLYAGDPKIVYKASSSSGRAKPLP